MTTENYVEVKRKARVGERIKIVEAWETCGEYTNGDIFTVDSNDHPEGVYVNAVKSAQDEGNPDGYIEDTEYVVLEPVKSADPAPLDQLDLIGNLAVRVSALEDRLPEAERRIRELESEVLALKGGRVEKAYEHAVSGQVAKGLPSFVKPAPKGRDQIVEQAKADVEALRVKGATDVPTISGTRTVFLPHDYDPDVVEFAVNREKRVVVALLKNKSRNLVWGRGKAKAAPGDVFNVHLGRAIALRRALGLTVPDEYLSAPAPDKVSVGDIVTYRLTDPDSGRCLYRVDSVTTSENNCTIIYDDPSFGISDMTGAKANGGDFGWAAIIDDSREGEEVSV